MQHEGHRGGDSQSQVKMKRSRDTNGPEQMGKRYITRDVWTGKGKSGQRKTRWAHAFKNAGQSSRAVRHRRQWARHKEQS
jgi:hypothetical protein